MEAEERDDPDDIVEIFKIKGNLFDYETPLCKAFNDFKYLLIIDTDLFTFNIQGIKTYEEYELNNTVTRELQEPWSDNERLLSATITLIFKVEDPNLSFIKWYQSLVRSFDQEKNNIQAQQKKKIVKTSSRLTQVEARLAEHRDRELKYCEKIRILEFKTESSANCIESLKKELELIKKEKEGLDSKLIGFQTASKVLDSLLESQRLDKNKEGLGYSVVRPLPAQIYTPPKKDMSWTGLLEFVDDTVTNYSRPAPTVESSLDDAQNRNPSVTATEASPYTISPKPFIKFVKAADCTEVKTNKVEAARKSSVRYAKMYRRTSKSPNGNSGTKLEDSVRTKRSRGSKSTKVVDYILQVKKKLLTKKLEDSEAEHQV
nr:hypothetical protein [Tanacetum cinerariifolium]